MQRVLRSSPDVIFRLPPAIFGRLLVQAALVSSSDTMAAVAEAWQGILDLVTASVVLEVRIYTSMKFEMLRCCNVLLHQRASCPFGAALLAPAL